MDLKDELMRRVEALPPEAQRELLEHLDSREELPMKGNTLEEMLSFVGRLDDQSAREMMEAIEAGCENVEPDEDSAFGE
jgi:hypothetical protein